MRSLFATLAALAFLVAPSQGEELKPFRTDADGAVNVVVKIPGAPPSKKGEDVLKWYQVEAGVFPPEGSAHAISGELVWIDHLERRFHLRVDRNDSQDRGVWDLCVDATMLPYGSIYYHGSPAALQDIPVGTHLHGLFYQRPADDKTQPPAANNNRKTPEFEFGRCFRLEDDFSFRARQQQLWKIESVDLAAKKLTAVLLDQGKSPGDKAVGKPQLFDLTSATVVYDGQGFADHAALKPGQTVLFNLTWVTLYGPGRITDIWLDAKARDLATARQLEKHRNHIRERGLAGWVDEVDDERQIVTITFFGGVDPSLFDDLVGIPLDSLLVNSVAPLDKVKDARGGLAVARESLMTYDPVNDRKSGPVVGVERVPVQPGSSGVRIRVQPDMLLEGYRPKKIVRYYPAFPTVWPVVALSREEQYFGRE
ncbi:MAG: hypothetical protein JNK76_03115 [Planctomycetales bacterium]|nr:hypothetical protein [Planctomycetales bacterium]MBN8625518.1 hypothetical protein [Planctomycetota bacterium]